jgi:hypothetical protein
MKTVNDTGMAEIKQFLAAHHKNGANFGDAEIHAWASDAEFQAGEGNPPSIEVISWDSVSGCTIEYTISDAGIDETNDHD